MCVGFAFDSSLSEITGSFLLVVVRPCIPSDGEFIVFLIIVFKLLSVFQLSVVFLVFVFRFKSSVERLSNLPVSALTTNLSVSELIKSCCKATSSCLGSTEVVFSLKSVGWKLVSWMDVE